MNSLEIIAVVVAILGIIFTVLENRVCWLINILASLLYLKIFSDSELRGQMLLQIIYIVVGVFGYIYWGKDNQVAIQRIGSRVTFLLILLSVFTGYLAYALFNNLLWVDMSLTAGSIIATYLTAKKYLENWLLWFIINLASIWLFCFKDLNLTATLYLAYAVLSVIGYRQWRNSIYS